ncbi:MAG: hypothetical protein NE334_18230 [Lentisphaeraceae bacterium]|nr:hypothetical protein [Lentisphaeraceae bacterium]
MNAVDPELVEALVENELENTDVVEQENESETEPVEEEYIPSMYLLLG